MGMGVSPVLKHVMKPYDWGTFFFTRWSQEAQQKTKQLIQSPRLQQEHLDIFHGIFEVGNMQTADTQIPKVVDRIYELSAFRFFELLKRRGRVTESPNLSKFVGGQLPGAWDLGPMEASETWSIGEQFDMIHPFFHGKWWFYVEFLSIWGFKMIDIFSEYGPYRQFV